MNAGSQTMKSLQPLLHALLGSAIAVPLVLALSFGIGIVVLGWMDPQGMNELADLMRD